MKPVGRWSLFWLRVNRRALLSVQRIGRKPNLPAHLMTGLRGEFEAMFFLRREGYLLAERRWRAPDLPGDLDLVAWEGNTLCFVEVKARTARDFAPARSAVDAAKQRMLRRMARAYKRTLPRAARDEVLTRFDVVSVYLLGTAEPECELLRDAFPALENHLGGYGV